MKNSGIFQLENRNNKTCEDFYYTKFAQIEDGLKKPYILLFFLRTYFKITQAEFANENNTKKNRASNYNKK